ncbi:MAG: NAD(P)H-dependent oxidoreductase [Candidatus Omnitrophica bacterium]|nr:NAD(P)H-dependent oxidoreductase [Candidatus Omnitrophota bacterium]
MKTLVVYYSYGGNTEKTAKVLVGLLKDKGFTVDVHKLKPENEKRNFFLQCLDALRGREAVLSDDVNFDLAGYDLVCIGSPVWAFAPTPAVNTYLDKMLNAGGKDAIVFTTYGSGTGVEKCINSIKKRLKQKGIREVYNFNIQQAKVDDRDFAVSMMKDKLKKVLNVET